VSTFPLTTVTLQGGVDAALALIPSAAGVGQIVAAGERNLVIGRPSNLRRWAASHLGRARPVKPAPGKRPPRPPTDLTAIAVAIAYVKTTSPFGQRLAFERLMARYVPLSKRRDLKRPAYLRLDPDERFPRLVIQPTPDGGHVFGPFRDSRAATRARDALYKRFRIRPCDFEFEPAPDLPLGLGCLDAQVESCAAPCLQRVTPEAYRGLAADVARALEGSPEVTEIPAWVRRADGRSLVVERGKAGLEVYPIAGGGVIEEAAVAVTLDGLERSVDGLAWTCVAEPRDDTPWLNAWRHGKHSGVEIPIAAGEAAAAIAARIRQAVGRSAPAPRGVGAPP